MTRPRFHYLLALLLLPIWAGPPVASRAQPPTVPDPFPLRRIVIPLERVPAELQRQGTLVQMPLAEFDAKVRQAAQAQESLRQSPRLVKAVYTAEFTGQALAGGSGHWSVHHAGAGPGILRISQLNLAVEKVKLADAEAVLGELDGKNLGLWIARPGAQAVYFDWSLRGRAHAAGIGFQMRVPACPTNILEIKLPADHEVLLSSDIGLISGPLETERAGQKLWRIQATGRSQIDFEVRRSQPRATAPQVFTTIDSKQELMAGAVLADFDVHVEAVQSPVTELIFEHDIRLQPYEVTVRQADLNGWDLIPAAPKAKVAELAVRLREPRQGALQVRIRCLAAPATNQLWLSPSLRLRQAIPRGEALQIVVPAAQPVARWDPGQFRLLRTSVETNGSQVLSLVDLDPQAAMPRRPRLSVTPLAGEWDVRQQTRLSIAPAGMTLVADLAYTARRGRQYQMAVQLPSGPWRVDEVAWEPKDALRSWSIAGGQIVVELNRALEMRTPGKMLLRLWLPAGRDGNGPHLLSTPELLPIGVAQRQCTYAIHVDPAMQATVEKAAAPPALPDADALSQELPPRYFFAYRDEPLGGRLRLQGPRAVVNARVDQLATLGTSDGACEARVTLDPIVGQPRHMDLYFSTSPVQPWMVVPTPGAPAAHLERRVGPETTVAFLSLAARPGFERLATLALIPRGESWRLRWQAPLTQRTTFLLRGALRPAPVIPKGQPPLWLIPNNVLPFPMGGVLLADRGPTMGWEIPTVSMPDAEPGDGELAIQARTLEVTRETVQALQRRDAADPHSSRAYRWHGSSFARALTLWTRPRATATDAAPLFDQAQLTTYLQAGGKSLHHYRFQAVRWPNAELPVQLPKHVLTALAVRLDGQWLDRLAQDSAADRVAVRLPMPLDGKVHWFDVWFAAETQTSVWPFVFEATALAPALPTPPLRQRQVWRLAGGLTPLDQERLAALDRGMGSAAAPLRRFWHSADGLVETVYPDAIDDWREPQRHTVGSAEAALRRQGTLGEALQRFVFEGLQEQMPLVLDQAAFREAGFHPGTNLGSARAPGTGKSFWDTIGLVYVPAPAAPLLTTRQRWLDWQHGQSQPHRLHEAIAQAAAHGQDALGQFSRADVWLRSEPAWRRGRPAGLTAVSDWVGQGWTEWEEVPWQPASASLIVVAGSAVRGLGLCGGAFLLLPLAATRRRLSSANWLRLIILLLVAALCTMVSLPVALTELALWPSVVLAMGLAFAYPRFLGNMRGKATRQAPSTQRRPAAAASAIMFLALAPSGWFAEAQTAAPGASTVFIAEGGPNRSVALVHPDLLQRLDDVRQRAAQPAQGAVLAGAQYQGKAQDAATEMQALFEIYSFSDQAVLQVPLAGVELKAGAFLDGAPVFPTATPGERGYQLPISGKGWHRLTLDFTVRHQTAGDSRELRCTIPALPRSQLDWQAPASWVNVAVERAAGETRTMLDGAKKFHEVRSQLGRESQLLVRWRTTPATPGLAEPEVREHYYWHFDPRAPSLQAVLAYESAAGGRTRFELALPEELDVSRVEVIDSDGMPALSKWQVVQGNPRRLTVDLTSPLSTPLQLRLQGTMRCDFLGDLLSLRLPTPLGAKSVEGVLAYWLEDRDVTDKAKNLSVTGLAAAKFKDLWARTGSREPVAPTRAYSFSRAGAGASLEIALQPHRPQVRLDLDWQVQPADAHLRLHATWAGTSDLALVNLTLPKGLKILAVEGANLHHWHMQDQTLQIWFEKPSQKAAITVQGLLSGHVKGRRFLLPQIEAPSAQVTETTIALRPAAGWVLAPERLLHLTPQGNGPELRYQAGQPSYQGIFQLSPAAAAPVFHGLVVAQPRDSQVHVQAALVGILAQGDFPTLKVHLQEWPASAPRLELSTPALRQEHHQDGANHTWTLQFPPGGARVITIKVHGKVDAGPTLVLPRLAVDGGKLLDQRVAWPAALAPAQPTQGLKEIKSPQGDNLLKLLGIATQRSTFRVWIAEQPDWRCTLAVPAARPARFGQALFVRQQAVPAGAGRWIHQADWLLLARDLRELRLLLPDGAQLAEARVNDRAADARPSANGPVTIPLPAQTGVFHLHARWRYSESAEEPMRPRLTAPTLADVELDDVHGIVYLPAGTTVSGRNHETAMPEQAALTALAHACLKVLAFADRNETEEGRAALVNSWRPQFQQIARHLEYQALFHKDEKTRAAVVELRKHYQDAVKTEAVAVPLALDDAPTAWTVARPDGGVPTYWTGVPPALRLEPEASAAPAPWWSRETLVLAAIGIFLLSWLPRGLTWLVRLWPEQLLGVAALGYACWGPSAMAVMLVAVAALGRLCHCIIWCGRLLIARAASPPAQVQS